MQASKNWKFKKLTVRPVMLYVEFKVVQNMFLNNTSENEIDEID